MAPVRPVRRLEPNFYLSQEDAVECQLKALQHCNFPYADHGIEVLYRFAGACVRVCARAGG